jgi:hypothetical protein
MGYSYLHVNTKHLASANTSEYTINLQEPLKHVTHVEVVSFSTQNDFHNVNENNNEFKFLFRGAVLDDREPTGVGNFHAIYDLHFSIEPDFYTHEEMIEAMMASMADSPFAYPAGQTDLSLGVVLRPDLSVYADEFSAGTFPPGSDVKLVRISISLKQGKTVITIDTPPGGADLINYGFMTYNFSELKEFEASIYHRLGFSRDQIFFQENDYNTNADLLDQAVATTYKFNSANDFAVHEHSLPANNAIYVSVSAETTYEKRIFIFKKCFVLGSTSGRNIKNSKGLAYETHQALHVFSDLVIDYQTTSENYRQIGRAEQTNLLVRVPIEVNRASWIHYISREQETVHSVNKSYFSSFKLMMTSTHSNKPFKRDAFQPFAITLKFTTKDDEDEPNIRQYESSERGQVRTQYERV